MGLLLSVIVLGVLIVVLSVLIWLGSPFFDMRLVLVDVVLALMMAVFLAVALLAPPD